MKSPSIHRAKRSTLSFPGEEVREFWSCDETGLWKRTENAATVDLTGIEALCFESSPFWSLNAVDSAEEAVALRWEGLGLQAHDDARPWTHWKVATQDNHTLIGTMALIVEPPLLEMARHEPSASMLPLPADGIAVWKELGRFVTAFTRDTEVAHIAVLTARELDADAAYEVRDLFAALLAHGFLSTPQTIHIWTACGTDFAPQLACLFEEAQVIKAPRPAPRPPTVASGLLPAQVAQARQTRRRRHRQIGILTAAAMLYVLFFGAWWLRLQWRESLCAREEALLATAQPKVERVLHAQERWLDLEAALDPDLYPVELFHQVVTLLPPEGIRLTEFQIENDRLILSGAATTVNHALGFKDRLAACEPLQRYGWNFPVPRILEDSRADFRAEGTLNGGGMHEAQ